MECDGNSSGRIGARIGDGSAMRKAAERKAGWQVCSAAERVLKLLLMEIQLAEIEGCMTESDAVVGYVVGDASGLVCKIVTGREVKLGAVVVVGAVVSVAGGE